MGQPPRPNTTEIVGEPETIAADAGEADKALKEILEKSVHQWFIDRDLKAKSFSLTQARSLKRAAD